MNPICKIFGKVILKPQATCGLNLEAKKLIIQEAVSRKLDDWLNETDRMMIARLVIQGMPAEEIAVEVVKNHISNGSAF